MNTLNQSNDLPIQQKPGYLRSPWVSWNVPFFVLLDYAVSISLKTNCLKKKTILYKKEKHWPFVKINIHLQEEFQSMNETTYLTVIFTNHVGLLRHIFSNQTLETTNHWLRGYH